MSHIVEIPSIPFDDAYNGRLYGPPIYTRLRSLDSSTNGFRVAVAAARRGNEGLLAKESKEVTLGKCPYLCMADV